MKICSRFGLLSFCNHIPLLLRVCLILNVFLWRCAIQGLIYNQVTLAEARCIHDKLDFNVKGNSPQSYKVLTPQYKILSANPTTTNNRMKVSNEHVSSYEYHQVVDHATSDSAQPSLIAKIKSQNDVTSGNRIEKTSQREGITTASIHISLKSEYSQQHSNSETVATSQIRQKKSTLYEDDIESDEYDAHKSSNTENVYIENENYICNFNTSKDSAYQPIRLTIWYDYKHIFDNRSVEFERLKEGVDRAVETIRSLFSVIPVHGNLLLKRFDVCGGLWVNLNTSQPKSCAYVSSAYKGEECLDGFKIPDDHLEGFVLSHPDNISSTKVHFKNGTGISNTDTVIYVTSRDTDNCFDKGATAYATSCQVDQYYRPVAGFSNFCPNYLTSDVYDPEKFYLIVLHEFFHILGFSQKHYKQFQVCRIKQQQNGDRSEQKKESAELSCETRTDVTKYNTIDGSYQLNTPAVVREARRHFNCSTIGGPLENNPDHLISSHWESRLLQPSLMTATLGLPHLTVLDRVTLAVFEDTGWYKVNTAVASEMLWGKNAGCDFGTKTNCISGNDSFFCTGSSLAVGCQYLHLDKGVCKTNKFLDGCKIYEAETGQECWNSANKIRDADLWKGETYNVHSRCFVSNISPREASFFGDGGRTKRNVEEEGRCYEHRCNDSETLEVRVSGSDWLLCRDKQRIKLPHYDGYIVCPPSFIMCNPTTLKLALTKSGAVVCVRINITFPGLNEFVSNPQLTSVMREMLFKDLSKQLIKNVNAVVMGNGTSVFGSPSFRGNTVYFHLKTERANKKACTQAVARMRNVLSKKGLLIKSKDKNFVAKIMSSRYTLLPCEPPDDESGKPPTDHNQPPKDEDSKEKLPVSGIVAATTVGAVCVVVFSSVIVLLYWKTMIPRAVGPINGSGPQISYHTNRQETPASISENGSVGQIEFIQ